MLERVNAGYDSPRTVPEQVHRQAGLPRLCQRDHRGDIVHVVGELLDVEAFTVGVAAAMQIGRITGQAGGDKLHASPLILPAVIVEAVADDHDRARSPVWTPGPDEK